MRHRLWVTALVAVLAAVFAGLCTAMPQPDTEMDRWKSPEEKERVTQYVLQHFAKPLIEQIQQETMEEYRKQVYNTPLEHDNERVIREILKVQKYSISFSYYSEFYNPDAGTFDLLQWYTTFLSDTPAGREMKQFIRYPDAVFVEDNHLSGQPTLCLVFFTETLTYISDYVHENHHKAANVTQQAMQLLYSHELHSLIPISNCLHVDQSDPANGKVIVLGTSGCILNTQGRDTLETIYRCSGVVRDVAWQVVNGLNRRYEGEHDVTYEELYGETTPSYANKVFHEILMLMGEGNDNKCHLRRHPVLLDKHHERPYHDPNLIFEGAQKQNQPMAGWEAGINYAYNPRTHDFFTGEDVLMSKALIPVVNGVPVGETKGDKAGFVPSRNLLQPFYFERYEGSITEDTEGFWSLVGYKLPTEYESVDEFKFTNLRDYFNEQVFTVHKFVRAIEFIRKLMETKSNMPNIVTFDFDPYTTNILVPLDTVNPDLEDFVVLLNYTSSFLVMNRRCSNNVRHSDYKHMLGACVADLYLEIRGLIGNCPFMAQEVETKDLNDATESNIFRMLRTYANAKDLDFVSRIYQGKFDDLMELALEIFGEEGLEEEIQPATPPQELGLSCFNYYLRDDSFTKRYDLSSNNPITGMSYVDNPSHALDLMSALWNIEGMTQVNLVLLNGNAIAVYSRRNRMQEFHSVREDYFRRLYTEYREIDKAGFAVHIANSSVHPKRAHESYLLKDSLYNTELVKTRTLDKAYTAFKLEEYTIEERSEALNLDIDSMTIRSLIQLIFEVNFHNVQLMDFFEVKLTREPQASEFKRLKNMFKDIIEKKVSYDVDSFRDAIFNEGFGLIVIEDNEEAKRYVLDRHCYTKAPDESCDICYLDAAEENQEVFYKQRCGHAYHFSCLKDWINISPTCPYCRRHSSDLYGF